VGQRQLDEEWMVVLVEKSLEIVQCDPHLVLWWRYEDRVVECGSPNPDKALAQVTRTPMLAANAREENLVHFAKEPDRNGKSIVHAEEPMLHGVDVVLDLSGIVCFIRVRRLTGFETEELPDIGLRTFNARAEHRLEAEVGSDQQVRVRNQAADSTESVHRPCRLVEKDDHLRGEVEASW
jgi:hypothetical protein